LKEPDPFDKYPSGQEVKHSPLSKYVELSQIEHVEGTTAPSTKLQVWQFTVSVSQLQATPVTEEEIPTHCSTPSNVETNGVVVVVTSEMEVPNGVVVLAAVVVVIVVVSNRVVEIMVELED